MTEQVMIYEIKSKASDNARLLFSQDENFFYWNESKFKNLSINDYVFVVNKKSGWALFSKLESKNISTKSDGTNSLFSDKGKNFKVEGTWQSFVRLNILKKLEIPTDWQWKSLGSSENTYLHGERISLNNPKNRILNIEQLKSLSDNIECLEILSTCKTNFDGSVTQVKNNDKNRLNTKSTNHMDILTAIRTKPFILLAGISGTGKSRLVRTLAFKTCPQNLQDKEKKKPGNFELIPVRPNWHDSSELMGYVSRINGEKYITTSFLKFIAKAWSNLEAPFFLCLDEMNLAPVEQYFAEYLSIIETRQVQNNDIITDNLITKSNFENLDLYNELLTDLNLNIDQFSNGISIPSNLIVIGTVNMDETTHSFSRKVLDRAMTFEMNDVDLRAGLNSNMKDWEYSEVVSPSITVLGEYTSGAEVYNDSFIEKEEVLLYLEKLNEQLERSPFKIAYRVRDEFLIYCFYASQNKYENWLNNALDQMTAMKVLSRIEGDEIKTTDVINNLLSVVTSEYSISNSKLLEMKNRLQSSGYTSYWT